MTILFVHNFYQQPGGEDEVFRQESDLLERHGHQVVSYQAHNDDIAGMSSVTLLAKTCFNVETYRQIRSLIKEHKPAILHAHNTFPLVSPAVYYAAASEGVPVVQTLHNYRLLCPAGTLYRDKQICERCLQTGSFWPAVKYACYHGRPASAAAATMLTVHRNIGTYRSKVQTYIALSEFCREKYVQGGLPAERLVVKPNFIDPDPGVGQGGGNYFLFAGRLTEEKGVRTMLEAWTRFSPSFDLEIAGDGDLAPMVVEAAQRCSKIRWLGRLQKTELYARMKGAAAMLVPSIWYEPFGMVVMEAFAMGLPVIASRIGALTSLVHDGRTGLHFNPGDGEHLAAQVSWLASHPEAKLRMRDSARREFEKCYTGDANYQALLAIYQNAIDKFGKVPQIASGNHDLKAEEAEAFIQIGG